MGDLIFELDGQPSGGSDDLIGQLKAERIGRSVEVAVLRHGKIERLAV